MYGFFYFVLMLQRDAQSYFMMGNEEVPRPCGLRRSWQCLHGKCSCEMDTGHEAQAFWDVPKSMQMNKWTGSCLVAVTPKRSLKTHLTEICNC